MLDFTKLAQRAQYVQDMQASKGLRRGRKLRRRRRELAALTVIFHRRGQDLARRLPAQYPSGLSAGQAYRLAL